MVVDGKLLKDRSAGVYELQAVKVNDRAVYKQSAGPNFIYHSENDGYYIGEQVENDGIIHEATLNRKTFLRSFSEGIQINANFISRCPRYLEVTGWSC